jgi:hypothetical protein
LGWPQPTPPPPPPLPTPLHPGTSQLGEQGLAAAATPVS